MKNKVQDRQKKVLFKKVLVTGGLGFIGAHLSKRLLAEGTEVFVVDNQIFGRREKELPPHPKLKIVNADIRDIKAMQKIFDRIRPDAVFHLAAIAFIPKCVSDPSLAIAVHLDGMLNMLSCSEKYAVKHFYYSSTADVYTPKQAYLSEDKTPIAPPPDVYGVTKYAGELMVEGFYRRTGIHTVITRFFNVYGPGRTNPFLIPSVAEQLKSGAQTLELGNLDVERDYVYVDDVVEAAISLMKNTSGLVVANVGTGKETSVRELIKTFEKVVGRKISVVSKKHLRRDKSFDRPTWRADIRHIKKLIGWKPTVSLEEGIRLVMNENNEDRHSK